MSEIECVGIADVGIASVGIASVGIVSERAPQNRSYLKLKIVLQSILRVNCTENLHSKIAHQKYLLNTLFPNALGSKLVMQLMW